MAKGAFVSRVVKAAWGMPCNQKADGSLWAGKGYEKSLGGQFGEPTHKRILKAIQKVRGDRSGRFWVDLEESKVTMAVGASEDNEYITVGF